MFRAELIIRLKDGQNPFFRPKLGPKASTLPKSTSCKSLVVESWLAPQNDRKTYCTMGALRYVYLSNNRKFPKNAFFFTLYDELQYPEVTKMQWNHESVSHRLK